MNSKMYFYAFRQFGEVLSPPPFPVTVGASLSRIENLRDSTTCSSKLLQINVSIKIVYTVHSIRPDFRIDVGCRRMVSIR